MPKGSRAGENARCCVWVVSTSCVTGSPDMLYRELVSSRRVWETLHDDSPCSSEDPCLHAMFVHDRVISVRGWTSLDSLTQLRVAGCGAGTERRLLIYIAADGAGSVAKRKSVVYQGFEIDIGAEGA
ncbi:hypothetical protein LIA77_11218 [Sarocladium implicatum]|nr:hypothetical protein LIA77_11218 [Sarocladium implicatum]